MIVGVNGRFLVKPYTGIGQYTKYLFAEMAKHEDVKFVIVVPATLKVPDSTFKENVEVVVVKQIIPGGGGLAKTYWEQIQVPRALAKKGVDLIHYPYPANSWLKPKVAEVVTVHDSIPWTLRAYRKSWLSRLYHDRCKFALRKAGRLLAVSESTKKDVAKLAGLNEEKIDVVYNAPSPLFLSSQPKKEIVERYVAGAERPYFLYVGGYDERKNVRTIVEVFKSEIAPEHNIDLVLIGGKSVDDPLYKSFDEAVAAGDGAEGGSMKGNIVVTGYVPEEDLPALYTYAHAFITLSSKEGFNLPLVEAAVSKVPIIASDIPVHREVAGETALYVDPLDKASLGEMMKRLVTNLSFYENEKEKAMGYECPYSWTQAAEQVLKVYKQML